MSFDFITPSHVRHYLFCPRFLYFLSVLKIDQQETRRNLVVKGREIHKLKLVQNKDYIRKRIGAIDKQLDIYLSSPKLRIVGKMDEVLFFENNSAAPLDYKFSYWENRVYKSLRFQLTMYAMLIEENYNMSVSEAYIVYVRSKNHLEKLIVSDKMKLEAQKIVEKIFSIVNLGFFPHVKSQKRKCEDCA